jgi:hypothetical protein
MEAGFGGQTVVGSGGGHGFGRSIAQTFATTWRLHVPLRSFSDRTRRNRRRRSRRDRDRGGGLSEDDPAAAWIARVEKQAPAGAIDVLVIVLLTEEASNERRKRGDTVEKGVRWQKSERLLRTIIGSCN